MTRNFLKEIVAHATLVLCSTLALALIAAR
jgi:hypothetical protein